MSACDDNKLIEMLADIQSDVRQIKSDLQLILKQTVRSRRSLRRWATKPHWLTYLYPPTQTLPKVFFVFFENLGARTILERTSGRVTDFERRPKAD
jgi:hypothetical protein